MRLSIAKIEAMANERPPGYVAAVIGRGVVDGEWLEISSEALAQLRDIYRPARPEHDLPSVASMAWTAVQAAAAEVSARLRGMPALSAVQIERRTAICTAPCEHYRVAARRCSLCGCFANYKAKLRSQDCPAGKWPPVNGGPVA